MWSDYFLFVIKTVTILVAIIILFSAIFRASRQGTEGNSEGKLVLTNLNDKFESVRSRMQHKMLDKKAMKALDKTKKAKDKQESKNPPDHDQAYTIRFKGDIQASQVKALRQEVSAILSVAKKDEEVVLVLESPGGAVSGYGLAASQLIRLKEAGLKLTVCVDQVAASGGYMMACIGDKIHAAPFSIIGSIGVLTQVPNIHRFLKRFDVDVDVLTAGKHKAPITLLGENTEAGKKKHVEDLNAIHQRFKSLVSMHRDELNIDEVSEGDFWLAEDAIKLNLVDKLETSDSYIQGLCERSKVFEVQWQPHKSIEERIKGASSALFESVESVLMKKWLP